MATTHSYNTITNSAELYDSRPLFGATTRRDSLLHWALGAFSALFLFITFICSFIFPRAAIKGTNIFFCICLILLGLSHLIMVYWYRLGDLDPKFLRLIYFNAIILNILCLCVNLVLHEV